jgi:D-cysteine desulfhydrase
MTGQSGLMPTSSPCPDSSKPRAAFINDVSGRELFGLIPNLSALVRPVRLAHLPTPITEALELAQLWGLESLHVKRDDLTSPLYGGSKLRNLEYFFGKALQGNATGVVTMAHTAATRFSRQPCLHANLSFQAADCLFRRSMFQR